MKMRYVVAIDGPSGAGKSTAARKLARRLGYKYIDTGAMYRAAALAARREEVNLENEIELEEFLKTLTIKQEMIKGEVRTRVGDEDVTHRLRAPDMGMLASRISAFPVVRERMVELQREMKEEGGVVMEGRDIGSVVFPDADYKFYITASDTERAQRRLKEHEQRGEKVDLEDLLSEIRERDWNDSTREVAPLLRAPDAELIDSTDKNPTEVVEEMIRRMDV
ncbi:MAG: (d)CMP kinase [bacterium]